MLARYVSALAAASALALGGVLGVISVPVIAQEAPAEPTTDPATCPAIDPPADAQPVTELPEAVLEAARSEVPEAEFEGFTTETEEGVEGMTFEVFGTLPNDCRVEVDLNEAGEVQEVETQISEAELPSEVRTAVTESDEVGEGFTFEEIETSERTGEDGTFFEIVGTNAEGQRLDVEVTPDNQVTVEPAEDAA